MELIMLPPPAEGVMSWIAPEPAFMQRGSHAVAQDGRYWLLDPVDGAGLVDRLAALGEPAGVIQMLDRHPRDAASLAERLGVPHWNVPHDGVPDSPFRTVSLGRGKLWNEVALWWPEASLLAVGESLGTVAYFRAGDARLGVHPFRRVAPPRALGGLAPTVLLPGHGPPLSGDDVPALTAATVAGARRDIPRWLASLPTARRRGRQELDALGHKEDT